MSMDLNGFDANTVEPNSFEPMPAGDYTMCIVASEEKPTKAMTGSYLQLELQVIEGEYQGRKVFDRLNLKNPNKTAVDIAQGTLSSICRAVGVLTPRGSSELHDKPMAVTLSVKPADGQYNASNEVKGYKARGVTSTADTKQPQAETSASTAKPPWA